MATVYDDASGDTSSMHTWFTRDIIPGIEEKRRAWRDNVERSSRMVVKSCQAICPAVWFKVRGTENQPIGGGVYGK